MADDDVTGPDDIVTEIPADPDDPDAHPDPRPEVENEELTAQEPWPAQIDDDPSQYVNIERRADGQWGLQVRGGNNQIILTNNEGWVNLSYALKTARALFPQLDIRLVTSDDGAVTTIAAGEPLPDNGS